MWYPISVKNSVQFPFWITTFGLLIVLVLPRLIQDGMFTDGVLYAAIAHNLANGIGNFWRPYFSKTMAPFFHQQPPLTFGIQSVFYSLFGDSIYIERIYSFATLLITAWLIVYLWRYIYKENEKIKNISWLPVVFWIIIPVCIWSYANNLEENTMGIFTLSATIFAYRGLNNKGNGYFLLVLAGVAASCAFLCKGFPGLFSLAIPFLYWCCFRSYSFSKMLLFTVIITCTVALIYSSLFLNIQIRGSLVAYLHDRVLNSILNESTVNNRLFLIVRLMFVELLSPVLLCAIILFMLKWKKVLNMYTVLEKRRTIVFFILIGVSASFPLIITREQREFYLVPSLPYFAIAFSMIVANGVGESVGRINIRSTGFMLFKSLAIVFAIGAMVYSCSLIGKTGRDEEQLHDIYLFGKIIPEKSTIRVYPETWRDWGLHNYLIRHYYISIADDTASNYKYFMVDRRLNKLPSSNYSKIDLNTMEYDLYERIK